MTGTLNKVMLIGHLGDVVKMHYFDDKNCVGRFSLATNETYTNKQTNEKVTNTEWHNIVLWGSLAERAEKQLKKDALDYHSSGRKGKIEVVPTKPYSSQRDLSLAYSPGVAEPCLAINKDQDKVYKYTAKGNLVAVISNGTAVLGLGDIGAEASKPVMEGKGLLFKIFADIDVFDIEINETNIDKFIDTVKAISPTFGGINLEDIKAPEAFKIEERLKKELDIPVMHDDQHGTAIISSAALLNALELAKKKVDKVKIVISGAGSAALACANLYVLLGVKPENIIMFDKEGVLSSDRTDLSDLQKRYSHGFKNTTLKEALSGADVFLGLSAGNILSPDMLLGFVAETDHTNRRPYRPMTL